MQHAGRRSCNEATAAPVCSGTRIDRATPAAPCNPAVTRHIAAGNLDIPHCASSMNHQLCYLENMSVPALREHMSAIRKLFIDLLTLQAKVPSSARFQLFLEAERKPPSADTVSIELFSLFSTTVSNETKARRDSACLLGEALLDFKLLCDSERNQAPLHTMQSANTAPTPPIPSARQMETTVPHPATVGNTEEGQITAQPSHRTSNPDTSSQHTTTDRNNSAQADVDDDPDGDISSGWVVAPPHISAEMVLPV